MSARGFCMRANRATHSATALGGDGDDNHTHLCPFERVNLAPKSRSLCVMRVCAPPRDLLSAVRCIFSHNRTVAQVALGRRTIWHNVLGRKVMGVCYSRGSRASVTQLAHY